MYEPKRSCLVAQKLKTSAMETGYRMSCNVEHSMLMLGSDRRVGWTRMASARGTTQGERETGESCMVCQTFASLSGCGSSLEMRHQLYRPVGWRSHASRFSPTATRPCIPVAFLHRLESSRTTLQCHPQAVNNNTQRVTTASPHLNVQGNQSRNSRKAWC